MINTTIKTFPEYTEEQLRQHVVTKAIAGNLAARCYSIIYHEVEFKEDEPKVLAYADRLTEISMLIDIDKPETMDRVIKNVLPFRDKLTLAYILEHPNEYEKF